MKPFDIDPEAAAEAVDAVAFDNSRSAGSGDRLRDTIAAEIEMICRQPKIGRMYCDPYRKKVIPRTPYAIFYIDYPDLIWIAAVYHGKRKPDAWMTRQPPDPD